LLLHGLHPDSVDARVQGALDRVRPYLGSHAGGIDYLGVDDAGVAHLRLQGSCDGCAGSAATVHSAVERAVLEAAPEVARVEVEGMVEPGAGQLLQIGIRCPDGLIEAVGS
jgi:Fe-S cluster biogenesis protein NfuA